MLQMAFLPPLLLLLLCSFSVGRGFVLVAAPGVGGLAMRQRRSALAVSCSSSSSSSPCRGGGGGAVGSAVSDFSSALAWEEHYARQLAPVLVQDGTRSQAGDDRDEEWHQEIPLEEIADLVERLLLSSSDSEAGMAGRDARSIGPADRNMTVLVVGCGTSRLPDLLLERLPPRASLVLLDSSPTCVAHLRGRYGRTPAAPDARRRVAVACGSVLSPPSSWRVYRPSLDGGDDALPSLSSSSAPSHSPPAPSSAWSPLLRCDVVVDKGMMDVLLCGDDWDSTVPRMLASVRGASASSPGSRGRDEGQALRSPRGRQGEEKPQAEPASQRRFCHYVLISYRLPPSTVQFLVDQTSADLDGAWEWSFDRDPRGSVSRLGAATISPKGRLPSPPVAPWFPSLGSPRVGRQKSRLLARFCETSGLETSSLYYQAWVATTCRSTMNTTFLSTMERGLDGRSSDWTRGCTGYIREQMLAASPQTCTWSSA
jgi:hypothetical protein